MPTEHEYKYLIDLDFANHPPEWAKTLNIRQGYLTTSPTTTRVRCVQEGEEDQWYFTFKQLVSGRVIEIESEIDVRDGMDLWDASRNKLRKIRHIYYNDALKWEIDFFYHNQHLYLILAEVELEERKSRPDIPEFLKEDLVLEVKLNDSRFFNSMLGDFEYASALYSKKNH